MTIKTIAIQGIKGAFHEEAAKNVFGNKINISPSITFQELTSKVVNEEVDYALMAIENTISGTILQNLELIRNNNLAIIGETYLRIEQNLGGLKGANIHELTEVSSHYMALNQCRAFFKTPPAVKLVESADTALSLKKVSEQDNPQIAAIGSKLAIEEYGLELLARGIETDKSNYTRFAVLGKQIDTSTDGAKVSLSIILSNVSGALSKAISLLHLLGVNLTKIESAPVIGKPFQYRFFLDFILHEKVSFQNTIEALTPLTIELKILGKYHPGKIDYT